MATTVWIWTLSSQVRSNKPIQLCETLLISFNRPSPPERSNWECAPWFVLNHPVRFHTDLCTIALFIEGTKRLDLISPSMDRARIDAIMGLVPPLRAAGKKILTAPTLLSPSTPLLSRFLDLTIPMGRLGPTAESAELIPQLFKFRYNNTVSSFSTPLIHSYTNTICFILRNQK